MQGCCPRRVALTLVFAALLGGCSRDRAAADSTPAAASSAGTAADQRTSPRPPPSTTGLWDADHIEERLDRAGLAPIRDSVPVRQPFMRVPGVRFRVGGAELQVYVYPDSAARERDTQALDTLTVSPRGARAVDWPATPLLIVSNNIAAILLADNLRQRERVRLALEAGLAVEKK